MIKVIMMVDQIDIQFGLMKYLIWSDQWCWSDIVSDQNSDLTVTSTGSQPVMHLHTAPSLIWSQNILFDKRQLHIDQTVVYQRQWYIWSKCTTAINVQSTRGTGCWCLLCVLLVRRADGSSEDMGSIPSRSALIKPRSASINCTINCLW